MWVKLAVPLMLVPSPLSGAHFRHREEDVGGFRHEGLHRQPGPRPLPRHGPGERWRLRRGRAPTLKEHEQTSVKLSSLYRMLGIKIMFFPLVKKIKK